MTRPTIDATQPWAEWAEPTTWPLNLSDLSLITNGQGGDDLWFATTPHDESGEVVGETEPVGQAVRGGLHLLGNLQGVNFPIDFVSKLSPGLQCQVVNERLRSARDRELTLVLEGNDVTNVLPSWRGVVPARDVAQVSWDTLRQVYGEPEIEGQPFQSHDGMGLRLLTPLAEPITRRKDDILQMGLDVTQRYGTGIEVALYVKRLVCLNGMTANEQAFQWTAREAGGVEHQLTWLQLAIANALEAYENLVERARLMADTGVNGDPRLVLEEHARAMRLPRNQVPALMQAWEAEPEPTEWGMLNAFTRLATHGGIEPRASRSLMAASGRWTADFDLVTARLPRPMAVAAGAEIIE